MAANTAVKRFSSENRPYFLAAAMNIGGIGKILNRAYPAAVR
jgi:hypothetical protein